MEQRLEENLNRTLPLGVGWCEHLFAWG